MRVSIFSFGVSLTAVGNPAPPMPTMPASRTRSTISEGDASSGRGGSRFFSYLPSFSTTICSALAPEATGSFTTPLTVPETGECTAAESPGAGSAKSCPSSTLSPAATTAFAGAPICCPRLTKSSPGTGSSETTAPAVSLRAGGCVPCRKVLKSALRGMISLITPRVHERTGAATLIYYKLKRGWCKYRKFKSRRSAPRV